MSKRASIFALPALAVLLLLSSGCGVMVKRATRPLMENMVSSVMKQSDPELVRDGAPAYLLMIDGLVENSPNDPDVLAAAAQLYSAYLSAFVMDDDPARARLMSEKSFAYAIRATSLVNETFADNWNAPFEQFSKAPESFAAGEEQFLFLVITTWANFIRTHRDDWDNIADISKVELLAKRLLELDETYYYGAPHLALGTLYSLLPEQMGGKPELAREHFERALEISRGKLLSAYVMYAGSYARLVFDRPLHDRLLQQVLDTPADIEPELTLINTLAKRQAEQMLAEADDYF